MYTNKIKYSGKNNGFSFKLTIFYNIYTRADVPQNILLEVFWSILNGLILNYYDSNTNISTIASFRKYVNQYKPILKELNTRKMYCLNRI